MRTVWSRPAVPSLWISSVSCCTGLVDPVGEKQQQRQGGEGQEGQLYIQGVDDDLGLGRGAVLQLVYPGLQPLLQAAPVLADDRKALFQSRLPQGVACSGSPSASVGAGWARSSFCRDSIQRDGIDAVAGHPGLQVPQMLHQQRPLLLCQA